MAINETTEGTVFYQSVPPPYSGGAPIGVSISFSSNNLFDSFQEPVNIFTAALNTDYLDPAVGCRLVAAQLSFIGIPPINYNQYLSRYGRGQDINTSDVQQLLVSYQCPIYFCAQALSASSTNGKPQQSIAATFDHFEASKDASSDWILSPAPSELNIDNTTAYRVDNQSVQALYFELQDLIGQGASVQAEYSANSSTPILVYDNADSSSRDVLQVIWQASNTTADLGNMFTRVANGFGSFLRTTFPAPADSRYAPTVFANEVVIKVRWAWLIFPLGLLITGHVFFAAVVWQTKHRVVRPWKGNRIPLLLANVDEVVRNYAAGGFVMRQGLEERIGRTNVRLEYDGEDIVHFRKVDRH